MSLNMLKNSLTIMLSLFKKKKKKMKPTLVGARAPYRSLERHYA